MREPKRKSNDESDNRESRSDEAASGREIPRGTDEHSDGPSSDSSPDSSGLDHAGAERASSERASATMPDRVKASQERDVSDRETDELE